MAEYNPSKIIKDGNTYNFRDTTKIPLVGTNALAGSIVPSTDNSVDIGASSKNFKMLYTKGITINGTQFLPSDFVDVTSAQTIGGIKTFSDIPIVVNGKTYVSKINASRADGTQTDFSALNGFKIVCNNDSQGWDNTAFAIHIPEYSPTSASVGFKLYDCIEGSTSYKGFGFRKNNNDFYLFPTVANVINLGTPSSQWNNTYTRNILIDNDINIASSTISKTSTSGTFALRSGINPTDGASIGLYAKDYSGALAGCIYMTAYGNSDNTSFRIFPSGVITVYNNSTGTTKNVAMAEDVVPRSGGTVFSGVGLYRTVTNSELSLGGGTTWEHGARIFLAGKNREGAEGSLALIPQDGSNSPLMWLRPDGTWTWQGQDVQLISDQRYKQQISNIDDKLLDAWQDVDLVQFKYNDAVKEKSDNARLHTGYVVQQIDDACKSHGVDISNYGLYCHEEYPEEVEIEQADGTKTKEKKVIREASEHYSLRYTEALIVECAYLRKCIKELRNEIEELKSSK